MASQNVNFDETLKSLYSQYKERGYITEDQILDCAYSADVLSRLTERLLDLGVVIREKSVKTDDNKEEAPRDSSRIDYDDLFNKVVAEYPELKSFIKYVKQIKPPQFKEWQTLFPQAKSGNKWAEDRLFEMYLRVVVKTAWHYHKTYNMDLCDAIQEGATGLLSAIEKFDISEYNAFTTFIARPIANFITRNCDLPNYVLFDIPTYYKDNLFKIYDIVENHQCPECMCKPKKNDCETLKAEIMSVLDCDYKTATKYLNYVTENDHEIYNIVDEDNLSPFDLCAQKNLQEIVDDILSELSEQEVLVLKERHGIDTDVPKTLEEVGNSIGATRERVRQIEQKALNKLKHPTRAKKLRSFIETSYNSEESAEKNQQDLKDKATKPAEQSEKRKKARPPKQQTQQVMFQLPWAEFDVRLLKNLYEQGCNAAEIARKVYRTKKEVREEIERLGLEPRE